MMTAAEAAAEIQRLRSTVVSLQASLADREAQLASAVVVMASAMRACGRSEVRVSDAALVDGGGRWTMTREYDIRTREYVFRVEGGRAMRFTTDGHTHTGESALDLLRGMRAEHFTFATMPVEAYLEDLESSMGVKPAPGASLEDRALAVLREASARGMGELEIGAAP